MILNHELGISPQKNFCGFAASTPNSRFSYLIFSGQFFFFFLIKKKKKKRPAQIPPTDTK